MKVTVAIDSFKGSLSSLEAADAIRQGILRADPSAEITLRPLADGGEGTVEALTEGMGGHFRTVTVTGPLKRKVGCRYGIISASHTAIIEMAGAAGITLIGENERDPLKTTTYGVGEVIADAIAQGCRHFIIGIGGSATNDGGVGMLTALGYRFLDEKGEEIPLCGEGLKSLAAIDGSGALPQLAGCTFRIACDVTNPLCGENGCSAIYGPQKGATPETIALMDSWLGRYAAIAKEKYSDADHTFPGVGAAGGLGYAFRTFLRGELKSGVELILQETALASFLTDADIVVTGEGRLDAQTVMGKAPIGVAKLAKYYGKPVIAFSGCVTADAGVCNAHGIDAFFPILRQITTLEQALENGTAACNLTDTAEQAFRLILAMKG